MAKGKQRCYVIMPFSATEDWRDKEYWNRHFEKFLKPIIEKNKALEAQRSKPVRRDIVREIIENLISSSVVIADLTDTNPNVMWELGVRQSFRTGTITILDRAVTDELPFDLSSKGTLKYNSRDVSSYNDFSIGLQNAIQDCLDNPEKTDSAVLDTVSGPGTFSQITKKGESIRRIDGLVQELISNTKLIKRILDNARENKKRMEKDGGKRAYITDRFRTTSIELLLANRYLEEDPGFYSIAHDYHNWISARNGQLMLWTAKPDSVEAWFLLEDQQTHFINITESLEKKLKQARSREISND